MASQPGFFDIDERSAALSEAGDPLERLVKVVDFKVFRSRLLAALRRSDRSKGGRPPHVPVLMFKFLVLQALYGLSDDQTEFQIRDRLSFMRFLGLGLSDKVPDAKTIWLFRKLLVQAGAMEKLFSRFEEALRDKGYLAMGDSRPFPELLDKSNMASTVRADTAFGRRRAPSSGGSSWCRLPAETSSR